MLAPGIPMKMEFTPAESKRRNASKVMHLVDFFIMSLASTFDGLLSDRPSSRLRTKIR
jgi:hypothetical protein